MLQSSCSDNVVHNCNIEIKASKYYGKIIVIILTILY